MPVSKKADGPNSSRYRSLVLGIACFILAGECFLGFIQPVYAHSGLDPEIEKITEKLAKNPDSVDLLVRRGQIYRSNGKFIESLQDLERAWLLDRENQTVLLQRALTLSALGRNKDAEDALDYFLQDKLNPKRVFALAERAHIRMQTGRSELAIADLTSAIQLAPTVEMFLMRGQLQESLGKLEAAAAGYHEGLAKLDDAIVLKKGLIRVQIAQKHYREALGLINEEVARASVKTPWYLQRAKILALMGQPDATRLAYEQALSEANRVLAKRQTAMQLLARAEVLNAMGQRENAIRDLQKALKKSPHFVEANNLLKKLESR